MVVVAAAPVLVATVAAGTVVAAALTLRWRLRDDEAPAAQAPVHTAMTMIVTQIPIQHSGTTTAMTIPAITAPVMVSVNILGIAPSVKLRKCKLVMNLNSISEFNNQTWKTESIVPQ